MNRWTAIIGANGSGKTHILEAIHILSGGTLHYFQSGERGTSTCTLCYEEPIGTKIYSLERAETSDTYRIQSTKVTAKKYRESLPYRSVFISPFDMNLLYYAPKERRDYIDSALDRAFGQFRVIKKEYENTMKQRNALLKKIRDGETERSYLDFWDKTFAEKAMIYGLYRKKWYNFLTEHMTYIEAMLTKYTLACTYESQYLHESDIEDTIMTYLIQNRERDIITGHTHIGPHLDDFRFQIIREGISHDTSLYLSRGENKMLLLGLKQLEILFLRKYVHTPIILLFDDLFAELDIFHAETMIEKFDADQIIITTQRALPDNAKWSHFSCINLSHA